ncbi:hypothetical protein SALB1_3351 [Salinisphaera sp. LB1]|nr:hypothetical protein SALB1_3351 [Salinisphaera sp. LB1]
MLATLGSMVPGQHGDLAARARKVPYASIELSFGRGGGLLVLAEEQGGLTFWQTARNETVVLRHGFLQSIAGIKPRLEMSKSMGADGKLISMASLGSDERFRVERSWVDKKGVRHAGRAEARWVCSTKTRAIKLPLTTRELYKCTETLDWADRGETRSVYWRDAGGHVWKADVAAWPGAPGISWQVARPWWAQS